MKAPKEIFTHVSYSLIRKRLQHHVMQEEWTKQMHPNVFVFKNGTLYVGLHTLNVFQNTCIN